MPSYFIPLKDLFPPELVPVDLFPFEGLEELADQIGITSYGVETTENGVFFQAELGFRDRNHEPAHLALALPSFPDLALVFDSLGSLGIWFEEDFKVQLRVGSLSVRLPNELLKPVRVSADGSWENDPTREFVEARLSFETIQDTLPLMSRAFPFVLNFQSNGGFSIDYPVSETSSLPVKPVITLNGPAMLGDSGFVVTIQDLSLDLNPDDPMVRFESAELEVPREIANPVLLPALTIENAVLNRRGFSGSVNVDWPLISDEQSGELQYRITRNGNEEIQKAEFFSLNGGIRHFRVSIDQNIPIAVAISGSLIVPYFEKSVELKIEIASNGALTFRLESEDPHGISISKEELIELSLRSLTLSKSALGVGEITVSGGLEPLLMSSDGMQWPRLDVVDLSIDSNGKFSIKEAWLDLKELATLDLWGFHFELRRIGLGSTQSAGRDRLWIDLSGGLRLIEQIPVALDVEGFRLTWPQDLLDDLPPNFSIDVLQERLAQIEVDFAGIDLSFSVPNAIEFQGLIRFFKQPQIVGFAGDVALRVPPTGLAIEAGLMVGLSFDPAFPFLYVYFGVELPAGIPLAQSGLALKGALGMFGLNVSPAKEDDQNWYYDWYKRGPIVGAHPTNKWKPEKDALAVGVGVTITTADGHVKGTRGLLVLSLPGPFLMLEGRALILSGLTKAEPPLRALAIFDGGAGTVQFNIEAEATLVEDVLQAYGMLEAFFDFNDITNWHIYLGQDTPRDRRIRGEILKLGDSFLFDANAYLMMDMVGAGSLRSRMGASIAFEPKIPPLDPLEIDFAATLEGDGVLTARPEQFSGELDLSAHIKLSAFMQSFRLSAEARFLTEGVTPLKVGAHVKVKAEPPAPFDPVEVTLEFEWTAPQVPTVESPLSEIDVSSRFAPARVMPAENQEPTFKILDWAEIEDPEQTLAEQSPIVPVDSQPIIGFKQKMNSAITSIARHPNGIDHHYDVGIFHFHPHLMSVKLYEHLKGAPWTWPMPGNDWRLIAATGREDKPLPGVWLAESQPDSPEEPSPRRLKFWTDNPFNSSAAAPGLSYAFPGVMTCSYTHAVPVCVEFQPAGKTVIEPGESWEYGDLLFEPTTWEAELRKEHDRDAKSDRSAVMRLVIRILRCLIEVLQRLLSRWFRSSRWAKRLSAALHDFLLWLSRNPADGPPEHTCLFIDRDINIRFRDRVRKVQIVFCEIPKFADEEVQARVSTFHGIGSIDELKQATGTVDRKVTVEDLWACSVTVPYRLRTSELEWLLETDALEGFDCLHLTDMGKFAIRKICYTTVEEVKRSERAQEECDNYPPIDDDFPTLRPGAYYRLKIETAVNGEIHRPGWSGPIGEMLNSAYDEFLERLTGGSETLSREFTELCFFQTEDPPNNLQPYVKWCYPENQAERFFYDDDIAIRFRRSHVRDMFSQPFGLKIQVRDTQGKLVEVRDTDGRLVAGYESSWSKAESATLFSEESVWNDHRENLDWPEAPVRRDDLLLAKRVGTSAGPLFLPRSRYQLEVVRGEVFGDSPAHWYFVLTYENGEIRVTNTFSATGPDAAVYFQMRTLLGGFRGAMVGQRFDPSAWADSFAAADDDRNRNWLGAQMLSVPDPLSAPLYSGTFVTSAFPSFAALVGSYSGRVQSITAKPQLHLPAQGIDSLQELVANLEESAEKMARARRDWEHAQVDYRFEELQRGKQELEAVRLQAREANAENDENFRLLADRLTDLYFQPMANNLEIYTIRDWASQNILCAWLRSPESLDVRLPVLVGPDNLISDSVGRTQIGVSRMSLRQTAVGSGKPEISAGPTAVMTLERQEIVTLPTADGTQVLLFPKAGQSWLPGLYVLKLTYHRNYGDESDSMEHRYDRVVEYLQGTAETRTYNLRGNWK